MLFSASGVQAGDVAAKGEVLRGLSAASTALRRSIPYALYRPRRAGKQTRFPVLYLLHGHGDDENAWLRLGRIAPTLDRMIAKGQLQPVIVVMPMAGNSWYVDDARPDGFGPIAQALTSDLIRAIDGTYPTAACREGRAIGGLSMGGFGAVQYVFENPDTYRAVISLSGSLFSKGLGYERRNHARFFQLFGGVYGQPFDVARYDRFNVFAKLDKLEAAAEKPAIWLAAGDDDFPSILRGTVRLHLALKRRGIASQLRVDNAGHGWEYWREAIKPALAWLSPKLAARCPTPGEPAEKLAQQ